MLSTTSTLFAPFMPNSQNRPIPNWLICSSVFFVMVAVYIKLWTPIGLNRWPEAFYTLTFFYGLFKERSWLIKHPLVIGFFAAVIATPLLFLVNYIQDAERAVEYAHFEKLIRVYLFLPIGYWLSFNRNFIYAFLVIAFLGFVTACLLDPELATTLNRIIDGKRVDFGLKNAQHTALWGGLFLIGFLCFFHKSFKILSKKIRTIIQVSLSIGLLLSFVTFYTAQTRAAYVGMAMVIMFSAVIWFTTQFHTLNSRKKLIAIGLVFSLLIVTIFTITLTDNKFKTRFNNEKEVVALVFKGDLTQIPLSSIGIRVHSWVTARSWFQKKPIVGWGGDARDHVIDSVAGFDDRLRKSFGHLHNTYLEFLVGYGIAGTLIALYPLLWTFSSKTRKIDPSIFYYSVATNVFFITANIFESYLFFWPGAFTLGLYISPIVAMDISSNTPRPQLDFIGLREHYREKK